MKDHLTIAIINSIDLSFQRVSHCVNFNNETPIMMDFTNANQLNSYNEVKRSLFRLTQSTFTIY